MVSQRLGPVPASAPIHVAIAFRELDPAAVQRALASARLANLQTSWTRGDKIAFLNGAADSIERFFNVRLSRYRTPGGREFFAGDHEAALSPSLRKIVDGVAGLDDFAQVGVAAIRPGGLTPSDVLSFYDIAALRAKGLDGTGETVVFPELNSPGDVPKLRQDLAYYAGKYHLPPFDLTVRSDSAWHPLATGDSTEKARQRGRARPGIARGRRRRSS